MITARLAALLLGTSLLAGCGSDEPELRGSSVQEPAPSSAPAAAPTPEPTSEPTPEPSSAAPADEDAADGLPPFPSSTGVAEQEPSGGPLSVVAVRAARQDGFDRVVLELDGDRAGEPGWRVEYVEEARQDGSGNEVEVEGEAVLQVLVTGVGYPFDTGVEQEASTDLTPSGTELVREVDLQATFEGQFQAFVGLGREAPFRVFRLADPARVVIDVATG